MVKENKKAVKVNKDVRIEFRTDKENAAKLDQLSAWDRYKSRATIIRQLIEKAYEEQSKEHE